MAAHDPRHLWKMIHEERNFFSRRSPHEIAARPDRLIRVDVRDDGPGEVIQVQRVGDHVRHVQQRFALRFDPQRDLSRR